MLRLLNWYDNIYRFIFYNAKILEYKHMKKLKMLKKDIIWKLVETGRKYKSSQVRQEPNFQAPKKIQTEKNAK